MLNMKVIKEAISMLEKYKCPFEKLANKYGYSLEKGDKMIIPRFLFPLSMSLPKNVYLDDNITDMYLIKCEEPKLMEINFQYYK